MNSLSVGLGVDIQSWSSRQSTSVNESGVAGIYCLELMGHITYQGEDRRPEPDKRDPDPTS